MDKLLRKIYEEILYYENEVVEADRRINMNFNRLFEAYVDRLTKEELEELKNLLSQILLTAQEEGFLLGMKYMWKLCKFIDTN